jgi:hypothetical protein
MKKLAIENQAIRRRILSVISTHGYSGIETPNGISINNSLHDRPFEFIRISKSNISDAQNILDKYKDEHAKFMEIQTSHSESLKLIRNFQGDLSPEKIELFKRGITFCPRTELTKLFEQEAAPQFFKLFSDGEIILIKISYDYNKRAAINRFLYTFSQYPDAITNDRLDHFDSLRKWNTLEPNYFLSIILGISQYLFYPYVSSFTANHGIRLVFLFIPSTPFKNIRPFFPKDYIDFLSSDTEMAQEHSKPIKSADDLFKKPERSIYSKYVFESPPQFSETKELIEWTLQSANKAVMRLYDVTNFNDENSPDTVDPVYSQEYTHSFMHALKDAASIIVSDSSYRNKATCFRVADILATMARYGSLRKDEGEFFQGLFRCDVGKPMLKSILHNTGVKALKDAADVAEGIYDNLKKTILEFIYVPNKRRTSTVCVKDSSLSSEQTISEDQFCGSVLRTLRNTQHGYLTRGDKSLRPSRFLSLIDGNTPDDFPTLAIAWILALLASPKDLIGDP